MSSNDGVKHGVEVVQQVDHLSSHTKKYSFLLAFFPRHCASHSDTHTHVSVFLSVYLNRFAESRDGGESDNVAEVQRALSIMFRSDRLSFFQGLSYGPATHDHTHMKSKPVNQTCQVIKTSRGYVQTTGLKIVQICT